jgi:hypothetical protein
MMLDRVAQVAGFHHELIEVDVGHGGLTRTLVMWSGRQPTLPSFDEGWRGLFPVSAENQGDFDVFADSTPPQGSRPSHGQAGHHRLEVGIVVGQLIGAEQAERIPGVGSGIAENSTGGLLFR